MSMHVSFRLGFDITKDISKQDRISRQSFID
jgi:hypothetical protein